MKSGRGGQGQQEELLLRGSWQKCLANHSVLSLKSHGEWEWCLKTGGKLVSL